MATKESSKGFGKFAFDLSCMLASDTISELALFFEFPPAEAEKAEKNNVKFVRLLQEKGIISTDSSCRLTEALREMGKHGLAEDVQKSFQSNVVNNACCSNQLVDQSEAYLLQETTKQTEAVAEHSEELVYQSETYLLQETTKQTQAVAEYSEQTVVRELSNNLDQIKSNFLHFSKSMRALYTKSSIGINVHKSALIKDLQDSTKTAADQYLKITFPRYEGVVKSISNCLNYYDCLEFEDWKDALTDITLEAKAYEEQCQEAVREHEDIITSLKHKEVNAKVLVEDFERLMLQEKEREREVNAVASITAVLDFSSLWMEETKEKAMAGRTTNQANECALDTLKNTFLPALKAFIEGLLVIANFFNIVGVELAKFRIRGTRNNNFRLFRFKRMKKCVETMTEECEIFYNFCQNIKFYYRAIACDDD